MGGNSPSHLSHEGDGGVTFVQGVRLSDKVIDRMRQRPQVPNPPSQSVGPPPPLQNATEPATASPGPAPSSEHLLPPSPVPPSSPPPQEAPPTTPSADPVKLVPPPPVTFHSFPPPSSESVAPPPPVETKPLAEPVVSPQVEASSSSPAAEPVVGDLVPPEPKPLSNLDPPLAQSAAATSAEPVIQSLPPASVAPVAETEQSAGTPAPLVETVVRPTPAEPVALPEAPTAEVIVPPLQGDVPADPPPPQPPLPFQEPNPPHCSHSMELAVAATDASASTPLVEPIAPPPPEPASALPPVFEGDVPAVSSVPVQPPAADLHVSPDVVEEELRQKIKEEMQRRLQEEIGQRRQELQRQLEEMQVQTQAAARAAAQVEVDEQVAKTLEAERAADTESLTGSLMKQRMRTEDERLALQIYRMELKAEQLEEREQALKKRDTLHKEHIAKLEAKCADFYRVTAESFRKGKEETHNRFMRCSVQPVCGDLQSQVLRCYKENAGKSLVCSGIASAYVKCVENASRNTGG